MKEQEAINVINDVTWKYYGKIISSGQIYAARDMAISALEEIQQYRALGTVEELKEAREKQKSIAREIINGEYFCPRCKYVMRHPGYCRNCGQHTY